MSVKDLKKYYLQTQDIYFETLQNLKELKEENADKELIDRVEAFTLPLKQNYERLSYEMFLLNRPNKKEKAKKYENQNSKELDYLKSVKADKASCNDENFYILSNLKEYVKNIKGGL